MSDFDRIIIDHLNIGVSDLDRSLPVWRAALAPLGLTDILHPPAEQAESRTRMVGFGPAPGRPVLWLVDGQTVGTATHIALAAPDHDAVRTFHAAALAAGARDNGAPGPRWYHPNYYGAFVLDPDGINLEAVCHAPDLA